MASDPNAPRSRRALLTAAAGAAGAVAASAAMPLSVAAVATNMQTESDNPTVAQTSITQATDAVVAFKARNTLTGAAALVASAGDETNISTDTSFTGAYGWAPTHDDPNLFSAGVWGDSEDVGTYGFGTVGVRGDGFIGVVGAGPVGGVGVRAWGHDGSGSDIALQVYGKVQFSRAGRATIGAGKSGIKVNMVGVSASSRVFAVLHSNRAGRFVRAVVPTTGSFTIYLNTTVTSSTYVAFFVIN
jgi:hypothetical protein